MQAGRCEKPWYGIGVRHNQGLQNMQQESPAARLRPARNHDVLQAALGHAGLCRILVDVQDIDAALGRGICRAPAALCCEQTPCGNLCQHKVTFS